MWPPGDIAGGTLGILATTARDGASLLLGGATSACHATRPPGRATRPATIAKRCAMNTTHRRRRPVRSRTARTALHFDRLEPRLALSAGPSGLLSITSADPASGARLAVPPAGLTVTFDRPLLPFSLAADFRLDRVAADGSESSADEGASLGESPGTTPDQLVLTPGTPLDPGHYRLYLLGDSGLRGLDGSTIAGGADLLVDDFSVGSPATGPGKAVDLGSPVGVVATASGSLDPAGDPGAIDYYRVELPRGHFWRLGIEANAARIGSTLLPALTVYDAQGDAISTRNESFPGDPGDPYAYLGLGPGVYYIGVSVRSDVPSDAGPFRLQVVADPADAPTTVVSSSLDHADPTESVATGLTLRFSGPLDGGAMQGNAGDLVQVVDASGRAWSTLAISYDLPQSALKVAFDQALPAGHYRVELMEQGGLVDLAGKSPVAPGLQAGTLAEFTVAAAPPANKPGDYGPVFWDQLQGSLSAVVHLGPGEVGTYRFVITVPATYDLQTTSLGSAPTFTAHVGGATESLDPGVLGLIRDHVVPLPPGVITLDVTGGPLGSTIDWSFLVAGGRSGLLLDNGVGQASGLGLRLIAPTPPDLQAAPGGGLVAPGAIDGPFAAAPAAGPGAPSATPGVASTVAAPASVPADPGVTYIAAGAGLIGHPSSQDDAIAVVGPVAPGGMTALSSSVAGIPQGLTIGFATRSGTPRGPASEATVGPLDAPESEDTAAAGSGEARVAADLPPLPEAPAGASDPQEVARGPGLVDRVSALLAGLVPTRGRAVARVAPDALDDAALADLGRDPRGDRPYGEEPVETAELSSPLGVAVVAVAAAHYHKRFGRWLGRFRTRLIARRPATAPSGPRRPTV